MSSGKVCGASVFSLIYTILSISIVFWGVLGFNEYQSNGYSQQFYSFMVEILLTSVLLVLACIKSRITYIILMIIYGISAFFAIYQFIMLILVLVADKPENGKEFRATLIATIFVTIYMFVRIFMFRLFYIGYKVLSY